MRLDNTRVTPTTSAIAGDRLIVSGRVEEIWRSEHILIIGTKTIGLTTGEEIWFSDTGLFGNLVVNGWNIYGYQSDADYPRPSGTLASLSLQTGAL